MSASMTKPPTPAELAHLPAATPPPGVTPDLVNPPTENAIYLTICSILEFNMLVFVCVRLYSKGRRSGKLFSKLALDDYLVMAGTLLTTMLYILCAYAVTEGKYGTDLWNVSALAASSEKFLIPSYLVPWLSSLNLLVVKLTFFVMFLYIFRPFAWVRILSYFGAALVTGFYFSIMVVQLYASTPHSNQSWIGSFETPRYLLETKTAIPVAAVGLGFDIAIIGVPLIAISRIQMSTSKKIGVGSVFTFGLIAIVGSAVGLYYRVKLQSHLDNVTRATFPIFTCLLVELQAGVISACMPVFAGVMRNPPKFASNFKSKLTTSFEHLMSRSGASRSWMSQRTDGSDAKIRSDGSPTRKSDVSSQETLRDPYQDVELGVVKTPRPARVPGSRHMIQVQRDIFAYGQPQSELGSQELREMGIMSHGE